MRKLKKNCVYCLILNKNEWIVFMDKWTEKDVLALAPDDSSAKNARGLTKLSKWNNLGYHERALWGECKGSGSRPYLTQVDVQDTAFKCSCPSRKFPCKHGLALLLLYVSDKSSFSQKESPKWVNDWIDKRKAKEKKKSEPPKPKKPVDEKAQAKRAEQRLTKVITGLKEVELWIKDLIRNGFHSVPEKHNEFWVSISQKMIDAQAQGLSSQLVRLRDINYFADGWQKELLGSLCQLYLVIQGFQNLDNLPTNLQSDIQSQIGWTQKQEDLKNQEGILDDWLVLGRQQNKEQDLTVQHNWLYGKNSEKYALVLNFAFKNQPIDLSLVPGTMIQAELVYFPSNYPMRAIVKETKKTLDLPKVPGFKNWEEMLDYYSDALSAFPWINKFPILIQDLTPHLRGEDCLLVDRDKKYFKIDKSFQDNWKLMAYSGGRPLDFFLVHENDTVLPSAIWIDKEYKVF